MKFRIERFRQEYDEQGFYFREFWQDLGIEEVLMNDDGNVLIGCKDSSMQIFLHTVVSFDISYHYIEMQAHHGSSNKRELWRLRLSFPIINGNNSNANQYNNGGTVNSNGS